MLSIFKPLMTPIAGLTLILACQFCDKPIPPNPTPLPEPALMSMYVLPKDGLKLRAEPRVDSKVLRILGYQQKIYIVPPQGPELKIAGVKGQWAKAHHESMQGYVFSGFLTAYADDFCMNLTSRTELPAFEAACIGQNCNEADGCMDGSAFFSDGTAELLRSCHRKIKGTWTSQGREIFAAAVFYSAKDAPFFETDCRDLCKNEDCTAECMKTAQVTKYELRYSPDGNGIFQLKLKTTHNSKTAEKTTIEGCLRPYLGRRK